MHHLGTEAPLQNTWSTPLLLGPATYICERERSTPIIPCSMFTLTWRVCLSYPSPMNKYELTFPSTYPPILWFRHYFLTPLSSSFNRPTSFLDIFSSFSISFFVVYTVCFFSSLLLSRHPSRGWHFPLSVANLRGKYVVATAVRTRKQVFNEGTMRCLGRNRRRRRCLFVYTLVKVNIVYKREVNDSFRKDIHAYLCDMQTSHVLFSLSSLVLSRLLWDLLD